MELDRRTLMGTMVGLAAASQVLQAAEVHSGLLGSAQVHADEQPFGSQRVYFDGSTAGLKSLVVGSLILKPGQQPHPPHQHVDEELLIVAEGNGEISMNGKVSNVGAGAIMYVVPNYLHGIVNTGHAPLTFYYIKWIGKA